MSGQKKQNRECSLTINLLWSLFVSKGVGHEERDGHHGPETS